MNCGRNAVKNAIDLRIGDRDDEAAPGVDMAARRSAARPRTPALRQAWMPSQIR